VKTLSMYRFYGLDLNSEVGIRARNGKKLMAFTRPHTSPPTVDE